MLKRQERLVSEKHNAFTEEINKVALSSNDEKRIQPINSVFYSYIKTFTTDILIK